MTDIIDKRGQDRPKQVFVTYPRCKTCKHFEHFIHMDGRVDEQTICVIEQPTSQAQIRGEDKQTGNVVWASWHGWPAVNEFQRCSRHSAVDAN